MTRRPPSRGLLLPAPKYRKSQWGLVKSSVAVGRRAPGQHALPHVGEPLEVLALEVGEEAPSDTLEVRGPGLGQQRRARVGEHREAAPCVAGARVAHEEALALEAVH